METREFGERLRELREQAGLSQGELAAKIGVNFTYLSKIESGVRPPPSEKVILRLAEVLDADRDELMALAGKIPSDIAEMLKSRESLQSLRAGRRLKKRRHANKKEGFDIRLRELREQAGLSQRELAAKVGVNFTYLSKIESGVLPPPSKEVILRLAEVLDADRDELMTLAGKLPSDIAEMLKSRESLQSVRAGHTPKRLGTSGKKEGDNIMKNSVNYKTLSRVAVAVVLVCAVAASLWFAAPTPVRALDIKFPSLPDVTQGDTHTFTVQVDVEDRDCLPVQKVSLWTGKAGEDPITHGFQILSLPIPIGPNSVTNRSYTLWSGFVVDVSARTSAWWGGTYAQPRWGYGYGYSMSSGWLGWGYHYAYGNTFGYGYGYGSLQGPTSITYTVSWTVPYNWPLGKYEVWAGVWANNDIVFAEGSTFTLYEEEEYGMMVGPSVAPPAEPGVTDVSDVVTTEGVFTEEVTAESEDGNVELDIDEGTVGLTEEGEPLSEITVAEVEEPPAPPVDAGIVGLTYDLGPDDATFDPPITLTFTYDPAEIPAGFSEEDLVIARWDEAAGEWVELEGCTVDPITHTITAPVSHFTAFTIIARAAPPPPPPPPPVEKPPVEKPPVEKPPVEKPPVEKPPVEKPPVEKPPVEKPPVEVPPAAVNWGLIGGVIAAVVVIALLVYFLWWRRRIA